MPTYVYKGMSKEHRERMIDAYMGSIKPPEVRGKKPIYHIDQRDTEEVREQKRERAKKWKAERKAEYVKDLDGLDASVAMTDRLGKSWVFEKGKPVKVPSDNLVAEDIEQKLKAPHSPFIQWEKVDESAPKQHPPKDPPK